MAFRLTYEGLQRTWVAMITGLSLMAVPLWEASAKPPQRHGKSYVHHSLLYSAHARTYRQTDGWYERNADKLPIGSRIWWDEMLRENRRNPG
jgi:hypothetical protein